MNLKFRIFSTSIISSLLLTIILCLGSQNLNKRHNLQLGFAITAPLPTGFISGVSLILGVISGGATTALMLNKE